LSERPEPARLKSLCGTSRRMHKAATEKSASARRPCRYHAIWACQGTPDRERRLAEASR
jgi:hypothetical protein